MKNYRTGYTLVEILTVVAIIGILSSILYASFSGARQRARDTVRIAEATELAEALEQYYTKHREYPVRNDDLPNPGYYNSDNGDTYYWEDSLGEFLKPYLPELPHAPRERRIDGSMGHANANRYNVYVSESGRHYRIVVYLATEDHPNASGETSWGSYYQIDKGCKNPLVIDPPDYEGCGYSYELCCDTYHCEEYVPPSGVCGN